MDAVTLLSIMAVISVAMLCIAVAMWLENPYYRTPTTKTQPTIQDVLDLNKRKEAERLAAIEKATPRGKVLAFQRKPWYSSSKGGTHGS